MKIQRLEKCEYERFRLRPINDLELFDFSANPLLQEQHDMDMLWWMVELYRVDPNRFGIKMRHVERHPDFKEVRDWMVAKTPGLNDPDFEYKFRHRMTWILHGLTGFPMCPVCGKEIGYHDNTGCWRPSTKFAPWNYKEHCCKAHAEIDPEHQRLVEAGVMKSLGVTHPVKDPTVLKKALDAARTTYMAHTGYATHFANPEYQAINIERIRRNCADPLRRAEIYMKANATKAAKSPEEKADIERRRQESRIKSVGSPNYRFGTRYYEYDSQQFDSSWELYAWIWHIDHDIGIKRCSNRLEYKCMGKVHGYYPDFIINGRMVEVKGDQFFTVRGDPTSPMRYPYFRDKTDPEKLAYRDAMMRAKQECMARNRVQIWTWKDIAPMKEYVDRKYGKDYLEGFRRCTSKK